MSSQTQIAKRESIVLYNGLSDSQKELVLAYYEKKFYTLVESDRLIKLFQLLRDLYEISGFAPLEKEEYNQMVVVLDKDICKDYKLFTFSEISIAFNKGIRDEYGKFYGLSNRTFCIWLNGFQVDRNRIEALKKQKDFEQTKEQYKEPLTEEQIRQSNIDIVKNTFERYRLNRNCIIVSACYEAIIKLNLYEF